MVYVPVDNILYTGTRRRCWTESTSEKAAVFDAAVSVAAAANLCVNIKPKASMCRQIFLSI